jgi:hypothetical protein
MSAQNEVMSLFRGLSDLLRNAKSYGRIKDVDLEDYEKVKSNNIHAKLVGAVAHEAVRCGFLLEIESKWTLQIGEKGRKYRPDLTLRKNSEFLVIEVDTIDMVGYEYRTGDPYAPKYVRSNPEIFENRLVKSVLLKLLAEQRDEIKACVHVLTLPTNVRRSPPWRAWRGKIQNAYSHFLPKYREGIRGSPKCYLIAIAENFLELYDHQGLLDRGDW